MCVLVLCRWTINLALSTACKLFGVDTNIDTRDLNEVRGTWSMAPTLTQPDSGGRYGSLCLPGLLLPQWLPVHSSPGCAEESGELSSHEATSSSLDLLLQNEIKRKLEDLQQTQNGGEEEVTPVKQVKVSPSKSKQ